MKDHATTQGLYSTLEAANLRNVILYAGSCFAVASLIASIGWVVDLKVLKAHEWGR
ncbi:hypothetical protein CPB86DRAFT_781516 [Serendipita vermifera]|nr:hypothetical protein CPB86DRAFT_781516 [Serendipita vermifera]